MQPPHHTDHASQTRTPIDPSDLAKRLEEVFLSSVEDPTNYSSGGASLDAPTANPGDQSSGASLRAATITSGFQASATGGSVARDFAYRPSPSGSGSTALGRQRGSFSVKGDGIRKAARRSRYNMEQISATAAREKFLKGVFEEGKLAGQASSLTTLSESTAVFQEEGDVDSDNDTKMAK
ncbi:hypothetical protein IAU60_004306 [Kwoniella sp. DSM 27419]